MKNFNQELYLHKPALQNFAMGFTRDLDDANDLVQDTLLKAINYANNFQDGTNLKGWLYTIMRNIFINNYRRQAKRSALIDTSEELSANQLLKSASDNNAANKFVGDDLYKALGNLEPQYYTPFIKYFEGFKYHEIAEEMAIPIGTVKTRIHVARQLLKKALTMYKDEYERSKVYN